jgi:arsenate reductase
MPDAPRATLLFVCRHGAAKSALAAELARRRSADLGVPIRVESRGLEPEREYAAELSVAIPGFVPSGGPRQVTRGDIANAGIVITFDLESDELPASTAATRWDGLPAVGEDPLGARREIQSRVEALIHDRSAD